jgi:hypothetical protein
VRVQIAWQETAARAAPHGRGAAKPPPAASQCALVRLSVKHGLVQRMRVRPLYVGTALHDDGSHPPPLELRCDDQPRDSRADDEDLCAEGLPLLPGSEIPKNHDSASQLLPSDKISGHRCVACSVSTDDLGYLQISASSRSEMASA